MCNREQTENENLLQLAEQHSAGAAAFSFDGLQQARQRANALLSLLLAGGGALGGLGLSLWATSPTVAMAALAAAGFWFLIAAHLACVALRSATVRSWQTVGLIEQYPRWQAYAEQLTDEGTPANGLDELRKSAVRNMEDAAASYREASTVVFRCIDRSYVAMTLTPVVSLAVVVLTR